MNESYRYSLPAELVSHASVICGDAGEAWLKAVPSIVGELGKQWSVEVHEPFPAGEFNFVAPATRPDGEMAVLKIAPPYEPNEIVSEAEYLRSRNGNGAVRLLEEDLERRAILLERAVPGENFADHFAGKEVEGVAPAIGVLYAILRPPPLNPVHTRHLDEWFDRLRRHPATKFPTAYADKALELYAKLSKQPGRTFYLHGDFHPGNIVTATRSPYLAIDPKGIIGHIGYDIAVFLNNFHWWQETKPDIEARLATAIAQFAEAFAIDHVELRQWAFAQMVLGAWWSFEDMPDYYDNAVAKADIWNV